MSLAEITGYIAAIVGTSIFIPQVIQTVKTKNTKSLSLPTFVLISLNNFLWMSYGLLNHDTAIILSQVFVFPMGIIILIYKIKYR